MNKVLFVCVNNVGRSQWAESIYNRVRPGEAKSAGTSVDMPGDYVENWLGGPDLILQAQKENGQDISKNHRIQLTEDMLRVFGKVIVMAQPETWPEYLRIGGHIDRWEIADPINMTLEEIRAVRSQVEQKVDWLLQDSLDKH